MTRHPNPNVFTHPRVLLASLPCCLRGTLTPVHCNALSCSSRLPMLQVVLAIKPLTSPAVQPHVSLHASPALPALWVFASQRERRKFGAPQTRFICKEYHSSLFRGAQAGCPTTDCVLTGGFLRPAAVIAACKSPAISHQSSKLPVRFA